MLSRDRREQARQWVAVHHFLQACGAEQGWALPNPEDVPGGDPRPFDVLRHYGQNVGTEAFGAMAEGMGSSVSALRDLMHKTLYWHWKTKVVLADLTEPMLGEGEVRTMLERSGFSDIRSFTEHYFHHTRHFDRHVAGPKPGDVVVVHERTPPPRADTRVFELSARSGKDPDRSFEVAVVVSGGMAAARQCVERTQVVLQAHFANGIEAMAGAVHEEFARMRNVTEVADAAKAYQQIAQPVALREAKRPRQPAAREVQYDAGLHKAVVAGQKKFDKTTIEAVPIERKHGHPYWRITIQTVISKSRGVDMLAPISFEMQVGPTQAAEVVAQLAQTAREVTAMSGIAAVPDAMQAAATRWAPRQMGAVATPERKPRSASTQTPSVPDLALRTAALRYWDKHFTEGTDYDEGLGNGATVNIRTCLKNERPMQLLVGYALGHSSLSAKDLVEQYGAPAAGRKR